MVGSRVTYRTHKRRSVERKKKKTLFQENFQRCSISTLWFNCGKRQASGSHEGKGTVMFSTVPEQRYSRAAGAESLRGRQRSWVWKALQPFLQARCWDPVTQARGGFQEGVCRTCHGSLLFSVFFFNLGEMPAVCAWASRLNTCSFFFFQQSRF